MFQLGEGGHVAEDNDNIEGTSFALNRLSRDMKIPRLFTCQHQRQVVPDDGGFAGDGFAHNVPERIGQPGQRCINGLSGRQVQETFGRRRGRDDLLASVDDKDAGRETVAKGTREV